MGESKDYYSILGVSKDASDKDIHAKYRELSKKYHPDMQVGKSDAEKKEAEEKFKEVNEAYDVLSDKEKRAKYDRFGTADFSFGGGHGPGVDPREFFRRHMHDMPGFGAFGDFGFDMGDGEGHPSYDPNAPKAGLDARIQMPISFEESIYGTEKEFNVTVSDPCLKCNGTGAKDGKLDTCPVCGGRGMFVRRNGFMVVQSTCPNCQGAGKVKTSLCPDCEGLGFVHAKRSVKMTIPRGIADRMQLRVLGAGSKGLNGGSDGNLYVTVLVQPSEIFHREGQHLATQTFVDPVTAALGGKVDIPTPWGTASITIPPGTDNEKTFRLKGQGVKTESGQAGDFFVTVNLESLANVTPEQEKLLKKLKKTFTESNFAYGTEWKRKLDEFNERSKGFRETKT